MCDNKNSTIEFDKQLEEENSELNTVVVSDELEYDDRLSECRNILELLTTIPKNISIEEWVERLENYTNKYKRLSNTAITDYIYPKKELKKEDKDKRKAKITLIQKQLKGIVRFVQSSAYKNKNTDFDKVFNTILKLDDHIDLSIRQVAYIEEIELKEKEVEALEAKMKLIEDDAKRSEKNYIAILGIFSAVVLAFTANLAFSSSVLENVHKASFEKIIFAVTIIAIFITNIILALFHFVEVLTRRREYQYIINWRYFLIPNGMIALLFFVSICYFGDDAKPSNSAEEVNTQTIDNNTVASPVLNVTIDTSIFDDHIKTDNISDNFTKDIRINK